MPKGKNCYTFPNVYEYLEMSPFIFIFYVHSVLKIQPLRRNTVDREKTYRNKPEINIFISAQRVDGEKRIGIYRNPRRIAKEKM